MDMIFWIPPNHTCPINIYAMLNYIHKTLGAWDPVCCSIKKFYCSHRATILSILYYMLYYRPSTVIQNVWKPKISRSEKRFKVWKSLFYPFSDCECNYQTIVPTQTFMFDTTWCPMSENAVLVWKDFDSHMNQLSLLSYTSTFKITICTWRTILHDATYLFNLLIARLTVSKRI